MIDDGLIWNWGEFAR